MRCSCTCIGCKPPGFLSVYAWSFRRATQLKSAINSGFPQLHKQLTQILRSGSKHKSLLQLLPRERIRPSDEFTQIKHGVCSKLPQAQLASRMGALAGAARELQQARSVVVIGGGPGEHMTRDRHGKHDQESPRCVCVCVPGGAGVPRALML